MTQLIRRCGGHLRCLGFVDAEVNDLAFRCQRFDQRLSRRWSHVGRPVPRCRRGLLDHGNRVGAAARDTSSARCSARRWLGSVALRGVDAGSVRHALGPETALGRCRGRGVHSVPMLSLSAGFPIGTGISENIKTLGSGPAGRSRRCGRPKCTWRFCAKSAEFFRLHRLEPKTGSARRPSPTPRRSIRWPGACRPLNRPGRRSPHRRRSSSAASCRWPLVDRALRPS
jgi:hypothetical protein